MTDMTSEKSVEPHPQSATQPWWMKGAFRPVTEESTVVDLSVTGELPPDLNGRLLRIGPNPPTGQSPHWFLGAGMVHEIELCNGTAKAYRNRYIMTDYFEAVSNGRPPSLGDPRSSMANTHIVAHAGSLMALEETHLPIALDGNLSTIGPYDFGGALKTSMTAHPKICPKTGEMLFFGYGFFPPYLTYHRVSPAGEFLSSREIPVRKPTMMHDFHITEHYAIFMDLPLTIDTSSKNQTALPIRWDEDYGARVAIVPRDGQGEISWFEIDPASAGHAMNAYEEGPEIIMDVCSKTHVFKPGMKDGAPFLYRWRLNTETGEFSNTRLSDDPIEFPRIADDRVGLPYTFGYAAVLHHEAFDQFHSRAVRKFNMVSGEQETFSFDSNSVCGEPIFVARKAGSAEDDGFVLVYVNDELNDTSRLCVFDATSLSAGPIAEVPMPHRVPQGLHGSWINQDVVIR